MLFGRSSTADGAWSTVATAASATSSAATFTGISGFSQLIIGTIGTSSLEETVVIGDVNGDLRTSIADIIVLVRQIIGAEALPDTLTPEFETADVNNDGNIDVADVLGIVNVILGISPKPVADVPLTPATVALGSQRYLSSGRTVVPVFLQSPNPAAGMQFAFETKGLVVGTPELVGQSNGVVLDSFESGGIMTIVLYSTSGGRLRTGPEPLVLIPIDLNGAVRPVADLSISDVTLVNQSGQLLPVRQDFMTNPVTDIPRAFSLRDNHPNPFNPSTTISYEVPRQSHITLTVYNLLGQEVDRIVDGIEAAGLYTVTWNGVNGQGQSVTSGIYLYRLTSSTGFTKSKRMVLLK